MTPVVIDIPVNALPHKCIHAVKNRRMLTDPAALEARKEFQREVRLRVPWDVRKLRLAGKLRVRLLIWRLGTHVADGDNLQKEILDAFTKAEIWNDDKQVRACAWEVAEDGPKVNPRILAVIEPYVPTPVSDFLGEVGGAAMTT